MIVRNDSGSKSLRETRVLLIRHAETAAPDRFHGAESDIGLGERGRRQASAVASVLAAQRPAAVFASTMRRAIETAEPIARACGLDVRVVVDLHERKVGPLSGLGREEGLEIYDETKWRWMAGQLDFTHAGAESYNEIRRRVVPAFRSVADRHPGETVVVVAHGVVIRVLLTTLLEGHGPADFDQFSIDFVAINDLRHDGHRWRAEALGLRAIDGESATWA